MALTLDEIGFVNFVDGSTLVLAKLVSVYLSSFGETFLASGTRVGFRLAPRSYVTANNIVGFSKGYGLIIRLLFF